MIATRLVLASALLGFAPPAAAHQPALAPSEIVAAAPAGDWVWIAPRDLLVMDLAPDEKNRPRRVVIQLMPPPFPQGWVDNIRTLAAARWWDGLSVNRAQDNYVVQWGDPHAEDKARAKPLPAGLGVMAERDYEVTGSAAVDTVLHNYRAMRIAKNSRAIHAMIAIPDKQRDDLKNTPISDLDPYGPLSQFLDGWPVATDLEHAVWPVHCYGMVGVGRDMPPDAGSGAELYTVIGHAPRHLDRNIALVGRVIEGMAHLSSLPRGTGALGFYERAEGRPAIRSVRIGTEVAGLPAYQFLSTDSVSFAAYADARANRRDAFFIRPAGGADICNVPVPVRRAPLRAANP